jgi:hypothetical protein
MRKDFVSMNNEAKTCSRSVNSSRGSRKCLLTAAAAAVDDFARSRQFFWQPMDSSDRMVARLAPPSRREENRLAKHLVAPLCVYLSFNSALRSSIFGVCLADSTLSGVPSVHLKPRRETFSSLALANKSKPRVEVRKLSEVPSICNALSSGYRL